jgi:uncharacterized protein
LKFNIKDIGERGRRVTRTLDAAHVRRLLAQSNVEPASEAGQLEVDLELFRTDEATVMANGRISGHFWVTCARCLGVARISVDEPDLRLTFLPPGSEMPKEELELEDLDTFVHDGQQLDLEPVVREYLVLAIPMVPLCREDCSGLCVECGVNLNDETCSCAEHSVAKGPLAEALSELKKKMSGG